MAVSNSIRRMSSHTSSNRLIHETSPYLLQHAHNPVDWYAWGPEALERARAEDKPILLSIGYSACHWCHVMEHESFEDPEVAAVMNALFVCIKVDREERPDLDKIHQTAHQLLTQRPGGWPLNMFLTPDDHTPFFGGTYFPKEARHGLPPFPEVLRRVSAFYKERRDELAQHNAAVRDAFARIESSAGPARALDDGAFARARAELENAYDPVFGGFGGAPKFPHPTNLAFLLRYACAVSAHRDDKALGMALDTLRAMAAGGLFDPLAGGFFRYSVDERWMIPHFEKMLYDNGPLLELYADAYGATGEAAFERAARMTAEWAMREMQAPEGGYYATLDADSEGHEGKFYVWTREQVAALLAPEDYAVVERYYGFDQPPNFENRYWHLHTYQDLAAVAAALEIDADAARARLATARTALARERAQRARPGRDEKIIAAWNGLMIKGMARAGLKLARPEFVESATAALDFVKTALWRDGRLRATYKDGRAPHAAYLDDYAFLMDATLALLEARWRSEDLAFACALADVLLAHFEDRDHGGFYFTADDHERLAFRPKPFADEATPAGNACAAHALLRLGHLLGETRYLDAAERALKAMSPGFAQYASAHGAGLAALDEYFHPTQTIVLRGAAPTIDAWRARAHARFAPRRQTFVVPPNARDLPPALAARVATATAVAYVCEGTQCRAPITDLAAFDAALRESEACSR